jgi:hypothetical protein
MRKWERFEVGVETGAAFRCLDRFEEVGQRLRGSGATELEDLVALENTLDGAPKAGPELDLSRDGALNGVAGEAGVEDEGVGELDGLGHGVMVA